MMFFPCSFVALAVCVMQSSALKRSCIPQWQRKSSPFPLVIANDNTCRHNSLKHNKTKQNQPQTVTGFLHPQTQQPKAVTDILERVWLIVLTYCFVCCEQTCLTLGPSSIYQLTKNSNLLTWSHFGNILESYYFIVLAELVLLTEWHSSSLHSCFQSIL